MYSMNERFREIFRESGLSQEKFADKIKRSRGEVANIIYDKTVPKEKVIESVCDEFGINPEWLKTGKLPKEKQLDRETKILNAVGKSMRGESTTDIQRILSALMGASPEELDAIARFAQRLANEYKKTDDH